MYTNIKDYGGVFKTFIDNTLQDSIDSCSIAVGYVGITTLRNYKNNLLEIATRGGITRLLIGMAFYEGLSSTVLNESLKLNQELLDLNDNNGVFVSHGRRYHGKIYCFGNNSQHNIYIGSSNFSPSGLYGNIECTIQIKNEQQKRHLLDFVNILYSNKYAKKINEVVINTGQRRVVERTVEDKWRRLQKHNRQIDVALPKIEIPLDRIAEHEKSNLNVYFGKGRLQRASGKIIPRPWYEIEIISPIHITEKQTYPKGDFLAFTDDGYILPMRTQGDYHKNLRSKDSLQLFGIWLKGKLEGKNVLQKYQPITTDTLIEYGNTKLTLYKISENEYYMSF